jgi:zinc/manganese transport system ATP-binding protein
VLLLDEPAAGLDSASRERTRTVLAEEAARGAAVASVTHDDASIGQADLVVRLQDGRLL